MGELVSTAGFFSLPTELLQLLLDCEHLGVASEHEVLQAVLGWAAEQRPVEAQSEQLQRCLPHIRFPHIDARALLTVASHPLLQSEPLKAQVYHLLAEAYQFASIQQLPAARRRNELQQMQGGKRLTARSFRALFCDMSKATVSHRLTEHGDEVNCLALCGDKVLSGSND